ncbi:MAG: hypothetical protein AAF443_00780 [Chlamydiota bacterium]
MRKKAEKSNFKLKLCEKPHGSFPRSARNPSLPLVPVSATYGYLFEFFFFPCLKRENGPYFIQVCAHFSVSSMKKIENPSKYP